MKDRIKLLVIIAVLLIFLSILATRFNFFKITVCIMTLTTLYLLFIFVCHIIKQLNMDKKTACAKNNFDYNPFISIVIPCHNEEIVIEATVKNILEIDYKNYELILVDDRSDDNTAKVIKNLSKTNEKIKYLIRDTNAFPGKAAALNEVMQIALGEAILVFDADAKIKPDFIKKLLVKFKSDDVGAVQAKKVIINREQNLLTRCQYNQYIFDCFIQSGRDIVKGAVELRGNGELIRKSALEDIGGWNNETITDDLDLSTKMHVHGWNIRFCPETEVYEEGILTYISLLKQGRRWAEGGIRRFLTYLDDFFFLRKISFKVATDFISYSILFISPLWLLLGILLIFINPNTTLTMYLLSLLLVLICVECLFACSLFFALKKYSNTKVWHPIKDIFVTSLYVAVFWLPLVFVVILKIIFMPKTMTWNKTVHGVAQNKKR